MSKFISKLKDNLIVLLILSVIIGMGIGLVANESVIGVIMTLKHIIGQFIFFCVPLIIIGFITPSITGLKSDASKMLGNVLIIAYLSSVGAALFATISGYAIIPSLNIVSDPVGLKELPELLLQLDIPQILPVMSALVFSVVIDRR